MSRWVSISNKRKILFLCFKKKYPLYVNLSFIDLYSIYFIDKKIKQKLSSCSLCVSYFGFRLQFNYEICVNIFPYQFCYNVYFILFTAKCELRDNNLIIFYIFVIHCVDRHHISSDLYKQAHFTLDFIYFFFIFFSLHSFYSCE